MALKIGDIVRNPKNPGGLACVIIAIEPRKNKKRSYFTLAPFTKQGWPSTDMRKWQTYHLDSLEKMRQARKYPHLFVCPECENGDKLLISPLRKKSIYEDKYQCKRCKKEWAKKQVKQPVKKHYECSICLGDIFEYPDLVLDEGCHLVCEKCKE